MTPSQVERLLAADLAGLGRRVRTERHRRGLSLRALARELGLRHTTLSTLELGRGNPSLWVVVALADRFNVTLDYLVGRSDDPQPADVLARLTRIETTLTALMDRLDRRCSPPP